MADDPLYRRLHTLLVAELLTKGLEENESAKAIYKHVLDVLWPEIQPLQRLVFQGMRSIHEAIDEWHDASSDETVWEYLEMTEEAYQRWVERKMSWVELAEEWGYVDG